MTPSEIPPDSPASNALSAEDLASSYASLRRLFHAVVLMMLVLSGTVCIFFMREVILARRQIRELSGFVANYERTSLPVMLEFRTKLYEFAKTNPDFMVIFTKYFNPTNAPVTTDSPVTAPDSGDGSPIRLPPEIK